MKVTALDLSLTATGVCTDSELATISVKLPTHATDWQRAERVSNLLTLIGDYVARADVVVMEGPSYSSEFSHAHSLGELAGCVKVALFRRHTPFVIVSPSSLKKFACGKGNAPKDAVFAAAVRVNPEVKDNNQGDAFWLHEMTSAYYHNDTSISLVRKQVLRSIEWPSAKERQVANG